VHGGNCLVEGELRLIAESGSTMFAPAVEAQMGHGAPMFGWLRAT
jgi:hypothetical protein